MPPRITLEQLLERHRGAAVPGLPPVGLELLGGELSHAALPSTTVLGITIRLASALDARAAPLVVDVRGPIAAPPHDLLRPELTLRRHVPAHLRRPAPGPESVVLAVLVGDDEAALQHRAERCGAVGIAEVWCLAAAPGGVAARYTLPRNGRYGAREPLFPGERVAPLAAPWLEVVAVAGPGAPGPEARRRAGGRASRSAAAGAGAVSPRRARSRTSPRPRR